MRKSFISSRTRRVRAGLQHRLTTSPALFGMQFPLLSLSIPGRQHGAFPRAGPSVRMKSRERATCGGRRCGGGKKRGRGSREREGRGSRGALVPHESVMVVFQCHEQVFAGWVYFSTVFSVRVCDHEPDVDSVSEFFASAEAPRFRRCP